MKKTLSILLALVLLTGSMSAFAATGDLGWTMLPKAEYYTGYSVEVAEGIGAIVCNNNYKYGVLDKNGKVIVPFQFDYLEGFNSQYLLAGRDGLWGVIDKTGKVSVAYQYDYVDAFNDKWFIASKEEGGKYKAGLLDVTGKEIIPFNYEGLSKISDTLLSASKDNKYGVIDTSGKVIIPFEYDNAIRKAGNFLCISTYGNGAYIFDMKGKLVLRDEKIEHVGEGFGNYITVAYRTAENPNILVTEYRDENLKKVDTKGYSISEFNDSLYIAQTEGSDGYKYGLVDKKYNVVLPVKYSGLRKVTDDIIYVSEDGLNFYCADLKGNRLSAFDGYINVIDIGDGYLGISKEVPDYAMHRHGIADAKGNIILPCVYSAVNYIGDNVFAIETVSERLGFAEIGADNKVSEYVDGIVLQIDNKNAKVFGEGAVTDVAPIIRNNSTMLPARFVAENLGAKVDWDPVNRRVIITPNDPGAGQIIMTIGSKTATVRGITQTLHTAPFIEGGRTYTPVRFIVESLGYDVKWEPTTKTVKIIAK